MAAAQSSARLISLYLTPSLLRGVEFAKLRAQERNLRVTERQRIGREGCVQAVLARFLMMPEDEQDRWIDEGVVKITERS